MANYKKQTILLDNILNKVRLVDSGIQVPDVTVLKLSVAALDGVFLHFGEGGDPIDLLVGMALHVTPPEQQGVFISSNAPFAGSSISLLFGFASGSSAAS